MALCCTIEQITKELRDFKVHVDKIKAVMIYFN